MTAMLTQSQNYAEIANALRVIFKSSETLKPSQIALSIPRLPSIVRQSDMLNDMIEGKSFAAIGGDTSLIRSEAFSKLPIYAAVFPHVLLVGASAFRQCSSLETVYLPSCKRIHDMAFYDCQSLKYLNLTQCEYLGSQVFFRCTELTSITMPNYTEVGSSVFKGMTTLSAIDLSACTTIWHDAFARCRSLESVAISNCKTIYGCAFHQCETLRSVYLPKCTRISDPSKYTGGGGPATVPGAFQECTSLETVIAPVCTYIGDIAFSGCTRLTTLDLTGVPRVPALGYGAFYSTPIGGYTTDVGRYGSVYVPAPLRVTFQTSPAWSSIADRIVGV